MIQGVLKQDTTEEVCFGVELNTLESESGSVADQSCPIACSPMVCPWNF